MNFYTLHNLVLDNLKMRHNQQYSVTNCTKESMVNCVIELRFT